MMDKLIQIMETLQEYQLIHYQTRYLLLCDDSFSKVRIQSCFSHSAIPQPTIYSEISVKFSLPYLTGYKSL
jgi:hypothetical protein